MSKSISLTITNEKIYKEVERVKKERKFNSISHTINVLLEELFEKNFREGFEVNNKKRINKND